MNYGKTELNQKVLRELVEEFLSSRASAKPSKETVRAWKSDLLQITKLFPGLQELNSEQSPDILQVSAAILTKSNLRSAFAAFAPTHEKTSIFRAWSTWNAFFDFLVSEDLLEGNPMSAIAKPKKPISPVKFIRTENVAQRLLEIASKPAHAKTRIFWEERDVLLVATFAVTGARLSEVSSLTIGSFDGPQKERRMTVIGKGDKVRYIPLWPAFDEILSDYLLERKDRFPKHKLHHPTTPLFVSNKGEKLANRQIQYLIEQLYIRCGMRADVPKGALVHALRHTFATTALQGGATLLEVSQLLGHTSLDTTRRYVEATANELRDAVRAHPAQLALDSYEKRRFT